MGRLLRASFGVGTGTARAATIFVRALVFGHGGNAGKLFLAQAAVAIGIQLPKDFGLIGTGDIAVFVFSSVCRPLCVRACGTGGRGAAACGATRISSAGGARLGLGRCAQGGGGEECDDDAVDFVFHVIRFYGLAIN